MDPIEAIQVLKKQLPLFIWVIAVLLKGLPLWQSLQENIESKKDRSGVILYLCCYFCHQYPKAYLMANHSALTEKFQQGSELNFNPS